MSSAFYFTGKGGFDGQRAYGRCGRNGLGDGCDCCGSTTVIIEKSDCCCDPWECNNYGGWESICYGGCEPGIINTSDCCCHLGSICCDTNGLGNRGRFGICDNAWDPAFMLIDASESCFNPLIDVNKMYEGGCFCGNNLEKRVCCVGCDCCCKPTKLKTLNLDTTERCPEPCDVIDEYWGCKGWVSRRNFGCSCEPSKIVIEKSGCCYDPIGGKNIFGIHDCSCEPSKIVIEKSGFCYDPIGGKNIFGIHDCSCEPSKIVIEKSGCCYDPIGEKNIFGVHDCSCEPSKIVIEKSMCCYDPIGGKNIFGGGYSDNKGFERFGGYGGCYPYRGRNNSYGRRRSGNISFGFRPGF